MKWILIFITIFNFKIYSQFEYPQKIHYEFEFDAALEISHLFSTRDFDNSQKEKAFTELYPVSLYISGLIYFIDNFALELKPGFVFGGEHYSGFEYGFYFRYYLNKNKYYASIGMNVHDNLETAHGTTESLVTYGGTVKFLALKVAYKPENYFAFTLSYFYPLQEYKYYHISIVDDVSYSVVLNHLVKLGFEFSF